MHPVGNDDDSARTINAGDETADIDRLPTPRAAESVPDQIDRYRVLRLLGAGGFGCVYLAHDEQLDRLVAIKVPRLGDVEPTDAVSWYFQEARTLASLDHPHIVPLYDVGRNERFPCFLVSKFVEGLNLARWLETHRPDWKQAAEIVATVAEALQHAHQRGLCHRDIKPANILIDSAARPFVTDFGLALKEEQLGTGPRFIGSPYYMSPEQARGEGHLVDGRTDIFSLGVVLYEMLTGSRPFKGDTPQVVLQQVQALDVRPPRQLNDRIPRELERICLKAIAKRATDRYSSARDFADDLRWLLEGSTARGGDSGTARQGQARVVPKGLRSFDANDSDFFLELLPGPHDREGLPESIRFWKNRIEERNAEQAFRVGLIYGPSGCGKSSLVKAGLLPRLDARIVTVYVEAAPEETQDRLLRALRKGRPELPGELSLKQVLAAFRRGAYLLPGQKLLVVIDQFEQHLHARQRDNDQQLVQALRQCDGERVQCLLLLRDDFWMAVSDFMRELEVRIVEGRNSAPLGLFDPLHARKVLAEFGRAYGRLPDDLRSLTSEQESFLDEAVAGLTEAGRVVPVRLSLFAEMIKGRPWSQETLFKLGGMEGVGASFLEESFSASTAPPEHRRHQKATRAVLSALLPERGTQITGHVRSYGELLEASAYAGRSEEFEDLLRILDDEVRLITPVDRGGPAGEEPEEEDDGEHTRRTIVHLKETKRSLRSKSPARYYKLTHDYLVPSLRQWLAHKQRETRRGRAQLRLQDLAAVWPDPPDNRFLPGWWDALGIWWWTDRRSWNRSQQRMMRHARRYYGLRAAGLLVILLVASGVGFRVRHEMLTLRRLTQQQQAAVAVDGLLRDAADALTSRLIEVQELREFAAPLLREQFADAEGEPASRLRAALGLAACGDVQVDYLVGRLGDVSDEEVRAIGMALRSAAPAAETLRRQAAQTTDPLARARCAALLLDFREPRLAREILAFRPDPQSRTLLIQGLLTWCGDVEACAAALEENPDPALRSGICAALGRSKSLRLYSEADQRLLRGVAEIYRRDAHPGVHSAAGHALRVHQHDPAAQDLARSGQTIPPELPVPEEPLTFAEWLSQQEPRVPMEQVLPMHRDAYDRYRRQFEQQVQAVGPRDDQQWYVERFGLTFLRIPPAQQPPVESFYLSDREISHQLYVAFLQDPLYPAKLRPSGGMPPASSGLFPVTSVSWEEALLFCNWLSHRTGRTACYLRGEPETTDGLLRLDSTWWLRPSANGYRLPTEPEWEHACRAGTATRYCFGDDPRWLADWAACAENSRQPKLGGDLLSNPFGCFDMHGNVWEWCQSGRVLRGGAFDQPAASVQSDGRLEAQPGSRDPSWGFRVARNAD